MKSVKNFHIWLVLDILEDKWDRCNTTGEKIQIMWKYILKVSLHKKIIQLNPYSITVCKSPFI